MQAKLLYEGLMGRITLET